jgi:two-component system phosphate regulon sensor histidine kinase PhoR
VNPVWARLIRYLTGIAAISAIVGAIGGVNAGLITLALALVAIVIHHQRHLAALTRWLANPQPEAMVAGFGSWDDVFAALYRLLRRQQTSESRLTESLKDFQQASAAMPDGMVILNNQDRIEWCNPRAEVHLGIERSRDTGQSITYLVRQPQFLEYLQAANYGEPLILRQSRGSNRILSVQLVPYGENQKLLTSRDVTDLERVETIRRDFIANVSHELRTPLTVLVGFLETVSDARSARPEEAVRLLDRTMPLMMDQASRMQRLVEDLLTLSSLESSHSALREEAVDVAVLAHDLYKDAHALSAGRHRIRLELDTDALILGSEDELRSALGNLISNAIRYTPEGGTVTVRWRRDRDEAEFSVEDTGIGIAAHHLPRLTERFYRVDRGRSRETGGTGLGLAIVKHVLNRHQARLDITSEMGRGSCFRAIFPSRRVIGKDAADGEDEVAGELGNAA